MMKFRLFKTEIYISFPFAAIICLLLFTDKTGLFLPTILAVASHELGHLAIMYFFGCAPKAIRLIPASVQIVKGFLIKPSGEILTAAAGPLANFILFGVFYPIYLCFDYHFALVFSIINLILAIFNLLPVNGLDGGTLLYLFLSEKLSEHLAKVAVKAITAAFSSAGAIIGIVLWQSGSFNLNIFILALYFAVCVFIRM